MKFHFVQQKNPINQQYLLSRIFIKILDKRASSPTLLDKKLLLSLTKNIDKPLNSDMLEASIAELFISPPLFSFGIDKTICLASLEIFF